MEKRQSQMKERRRACFEPLLR